MNRLLRIFALCLFQLVLFTQVGLAADTYSSSYYVQGDDTHTAGEMVNIEGYVMNDGTVSSGTVATLTFGVSGGADFTAANWNYQVDDFCAYLSGNGENGTSTSGTLYTICPVNNGYMTVAVVLNANKKFYILEDDVALEGFNGMTVDNQYRGTFNFPVQAGKTYKVYAAGSKLGFYGLKYLYTPDPTATFSAYSLTVRSNIGKNVSMSHQGTSTQVAGNTLRIETYSGNNGYRFKHWTANGEVVSTESYFQYTMPANDVVLEAVYEFNPTNPGDPASAENTYKLTLVSQPAKAGNFSGSVDSKVSAGSSTWVYTYNNQNGYVFREWQIDGQKVSSQREFEFTMPERNVTLTAVYEFKPTSPGNPGTNSFNADGELMLDDFTTNDAYYSAYRSVNGEWDKVQTIMMIGEVSRWDVHDLVYYTQNCRSLDISRTTGMEQVYAYQFENKEHLTTISLPATVTEIVADAFSGCTSLNRLNVYAVTPPTLHKSAFGSGDNSFAGQVVVYVPASALALYQEADVWKDMAIFPFTNEVSDLEVNLPQGTDPTTYKDMYLEAVNTQSGQRLRYVLTESLTYTFSSIINNTTWDIALKNASDEVLGEIKNVTIDNKTVSRTFESLKAPKNVTLKVLNTASEDVTAQTTVTWTDQKGNFLTQGATLKSLLEGTVVKYSVVLSEALAMQYQLPEGGEYTVTAGDDNSVNIQLSALPQLTISGAVTDHNAQGALADAIVAVSQTINGRYSKTFTTKTDAEGQWSLMVFDAPTEITVSKAKYVSQTKTYEALTATIETFDLMDINGTTVNLTLTYQPIDGDPKPYDDVANVAYTVINMTTGAVITDLSVQYPEIVMLNQLTDGTQLAITAYSKNQKFEPVKATAVVDHNKATATFVIKQLGGIKASYSLTENSGTCVGILYDANGQFMKRYEYVDKQLIISELPDGTYTLVTMANSQFFNSVGLLSQFAESGLREGVDYVKETFTVQSGVRTIVTFTRIPYFDETKLYYTGANTSFTANKSQVTAGQYLTLRGQVDFKAAYADKVSNVSLIIDLTDACEFVANSVMLGKSLTSYTLAGKQLIVPIGTSTEQVRFCVIPTKEGMFEPSASVSFSISGKDVLQPIGTAQTQVKGVTITVPATTAQPQFTASGTATAKSDVYVYADDLLVGKTTVKPNGKWTAQCALTSPADLSEHPVYARIVTPEKAELITDTKIIQYDENAILAQQVNMSFYNGWLHQTVSVNWDMIEKKANPTSYMFYTTTDFTFTISFTANDKDKVKDVQLVVYKNNNSYDILTASYNTKKQIWVVSRRYNSNALPTAVKVKYVINGVQQTLSEDKDDEGIEHSNPILDPSGYVYEAVSSNRLQGVTASIYYKEMVEDLYGDKHEQVVLWNAEDYAQKNPLFTDENGMYSWDVPNGLWQVRLEKEGYLKTQSEWLPVPPPQLDVNMSMTQMKQPTVISAQAFSQGIEFEFDKYMNPETLTTDNIMVTRNGNPVTGQLVLVNDEAAYEGAAQRYASKVRFEMGEGDELLSTDAVRLTVKKAVESYAGVTMQEDYTQNFEVVPVVRSIQVESGLDLVNVTYGQNRTVTVAALPADAAKGQTLNVQSLSEIATVNAALLILDENGQGELVISGELPGSTVLNFSVEGTDVVGQLTVNVLEAENLKTLAPRASRVSGSKLYRGAKIQLSSETEDAVIKYTLDGSNPAEAGDKALTYNPDEAIVIADDEVTINAIATGKDLDPSNMESFSYELKKSAIGYQLPAGWTWISHNMESPVATSQFATQVKRIVSQTDEVINDPQFGFVGGLTHLQPAVGYKVETLEDGEKNIQDYEFNANDHTLDVHVGWNWIGYPLTQVMTVAEALTYFDATSGDMVLGQDGFVEYDGTEWKGTLEGMKPGQGYLFKSATSASIQFNTNYVSKAVNHVGRRNWLIGSPWAFNKHAYPNIMPLTAEFFVDGVRSTDSEFVVAAFAGDECRGVGQWCEGRLMMNVYGNGGEQLSFKAYNKQSEQYFTVAETQTFKADNEGSWFAPIALTLGSETTGIEALSDDLSVTPAVARDHITVSAGGRYISRLSLTNMSGVTVLDVSNLGTGATVTTSSMQEGLYILTVQAEGKTYYKKILKANN